MREAGRIDPLILDLGRQLANISKWREFRDLGQAEIADIARLNRAGRALGTDITGEVSRDALVEAADAVLGSLDPAAIDPSKSLLLNTAAGVRQAFSNPQMIPLSAWEFEPLIRDIVQERASPIEAFTTRYRPYRTHGPWVEAGLVDAIAWEAMERRVVAPIDEVGPLLASFDLDGEV